MATIKKFPLGENENEPPPFTEWPEYDPDQREQPKGNGHDRDGDLPELHFYGEPDTRPLRSWAVTDLLEASCLAILAGPTGTAKTFLGCDLMASFITGMDFGRFKVERTGGVLIIFAEFPEQAKPRIEAVVKAKVAPHYASLGQEMPALPIAWQEEIDDISTPAGYAKLVRQINRTQNAMRERFNIDLALVIIDTSSAAAPNYKMNDPQETSKLYANLQTVRRSTNTIIALIDHFGKDQERGTVGSVQKEQKADTVLYAKTLGEDFEMFVFKVRNAKRGYGVAFRLLPVNEPVGTCVVQWLNNGEEIKHKAKGRPPDNLPNVLKAINRALNDHGVVRICRDSVERNTVTWQQAFDEYLELTPPEDSDPEKDIAKSERKFKDAINQKSGQEVIGMQNSKKRDAANALLWLIHLARA